MRVGVVVDGTAESQALRRLLPRIETPQHIQILNPAYADMQPGAPARQLVRAAGPRIEMLEQRGAEVILVLLDRETQADCAPTLARTLREAFHDAGYGVCEVVVKDRQFENWLIADPDAFVGMPARFAMTNGFRNRVVPNKADNVVNPEDLINRIANGPRYHKRGDAVRLCERLDIDRAGQHSRSFRRLLRLVEHPSYQEQSKQPRE